MPSNRRRSHRSVCLPPQDRQSIAWTAITAALFDPGYRLQADRLGSRESRVERVEVLVRSLYGDCFDCPTLTIAGSINLVGIHPCETIRKDRCATAGQGSDATASVVADSLTQWVGESPGHEMVRCRNCAWMFTVKPGFERAACSGRVATCRAILSRCRPRSRRLRLSAQRPGRRRVIVGAVLDGPGDVCST